MPVIITAAAVVSIISGILTVVLIVTGQADVARVNKTECRLLSKAVKNLGHMLRLVEDGVNTYSGAQLQALYLTLEAIKESMANAAAVVRESALGKNKLWDFVRAGGIKSKLLCARDDLQASAALGQYVALCRPASPAVVAMGVPAEGGSSRTAAAPAPYGTTPDAGLCDAATRGSLDEVRVLLSSMQARGGSVDFRNKDGRTALMLAARAGHIVVMDILVRHEARLDLSDKNGRTALMLAARKGHDQVVRDLLDHRARADLSDKYQETALMQASLRKCARVVKELQSRTLAAPPPRA